MGYNVRVLGLTLAAGLLAVSAAAQSLPVTYPLIAQRPDSVGAVAVPYTADYAPCCSAFSASTESIYHPTLPVTGVQVLAILTAMTERDAVRVRVTNTATGETETVDLPVPPIIGQARPVAVWLDVPAWNARTVEHLYALETRGAPLLYGAKMRVLYRVTP